MHGGGLPSERWRKTSSYCGVDNCVLVIHRSDDVQVAVKASSDSTRLTFMFTSWHEFIDGIKDGIFDQPIT